VYIIGSKAAPTLEGLIIVNGNASGQTANCPTTHGGSAGCGGGIFVHQASPIIHNNTITNNIAAGSTGITGYGGGIYLSAADAAVVEGNTIISNTASQATSYGSGGGICLQESDTQVMDNLITENYAASTGSYGWGGGITTYMGAPTIRGNTISQNWANKWANLNFGSALSSFYDGSLVQDNLISDNHGIRAVYLQYSTARLERNRIEDNDTDRGVDIFRAYSEGPSLVNNVIARSGDSVRADGHISENLVVSLLHNTLVGSGTGFGVLAEDYVTILMTNTIVCSNTWGISTTYPSSSTILPGSTLFWANDHNGIQGSQSVQGNPAFQSDGYHLSIGSGALEAGASSWVSDDIDHQARPFGNLPEIGADEWYAMLLYMPLVVR